MSQDANTGGARLVAIAGGSCSGKTTLANALRAALSHAVVVSMDWYYHDLAHLSVEERAGYNFDHPQAIDVALLLEQLARLRAAESVEAPSYDFATHTRTGVLQRLSPAPYVILEGIHALYWEELRNAADTRVFIELEDHVCFDRRVDRDVRERGRDHGSVSRQFMATVVKTHVAHVRQHAHFVVRGDAPIHASVDRIVRHLTANQTPESERR